MAARVDRMPTVSLAPASQHGLRCPDQILIHHPGSVKLESESQIHRHHLGMWKEPVKQESEKLAFRLGCDSFQQEYSRQVVKLLCIFNYKMRVIISTLLSLAVSCKYREQRLFLHLFWREFSALLPMLLPICTLPISSFFKVR